MLVPEIPRNAEPRTGLSMGEHTRDHGRASGGSTRARAGRARGRPAISTSPPPTTRGFFDDLVTPYLGLERDQNLRPDSTVEKLAKLKPVFGGEDGTMTAATRRRSPTAPPPCCSPPRSGRSEHGLTVLAYFVDAETAAVDYVGKREGLLMAPAYAVPRMLDRNGLTLQDFDFYEIHEAFAAQVLCTLKAWEDPVFCRERLGLDEPLGSIDRAKLNVNGGSLAAGHPFAATGGRIVANLAKLLHERGGGRGLISICAAGGQGVVAILESAGGDPMSDTLLAARQQPGRRRSSPRTLGLPQPVELDRYEPGAPLIDGRVLLGAAPGGRCGEAVAACSPSRGRRRQPARRRGPRGARRDVDRRRHLERRGTRGAALKALVFDATGIADSSAELRELWRFFHPAIRRLEPSGRVIVLGTPPGDCDDRRARRPRSARSRASSARLGKEVGATAPPRSSSTSPPGAEGQLGSTPALLPLAALGLRLRPGGRGSAPAATCPRVDWERPLPARSRSSPAPRAGSAQRSRTSSPATAPMSSASTCPPSPTTSSGSPSRSAARRSPPTSPPPTRRRRSPTRSTREHGGVDVVVHNAGVTRDKTLAGMDAEERWSVLIEINLSAEERINDELLARDGLLREDGRIVCVSSMSGIAGNAGQTNYATSKAGVIGMVEAMAPGARRARGDDQRGRPRASSRRR